MHDSYRIVRFLFFDVRCQAVSIFFGACKNHYAFELSLLLGVPLEEPLFVLWQLDKTHDLWFLQHPDVFQFQLLWVCYAHLARLSIAEGIVAEKNKVCRFLGVRLTIFLTSGRNPISSIRSTSSRTKISIPSMLTIPLSIKSINLPGVAIRISTPDFIPSICLPYPTPP